MLPDFLVIGVERAATTWLQKVFEKHPEIFVPQIKEVHFFDSNYNRGVDWYENYFSGDKDKVQGEITPRYFYMKEVPGRVHHVIPDCKLILLLRDPVKRAYSHYKRMRYVTGRYEGSFDEAIKDHRKAVLEQGYYSAHLQNWLEHFSEDQFLFLQFENMMEDKDRAFQQLANFLQVDKENFERLDQRVNASKEPVSKGLYRIGAWVRQTLLEYGGDRLVDIAYSLGIPSLFEINLSGEIPEMNEEMKDRLRTEYLPYVNELEEMTGLQLEEWK